VPLTKKKTKIQRIAICSSASFYAKVLEVEKDLKKLGFKVSVPLTSKVMEKTGNFNVATYRTWLKDERDFTRKAFLMKNHFNKIVRSDAVLIVNLIKNAIDGYIGGNGLMEMGIAFWLGKPVFVLSRVSKEHPLYEEILGVRPVFIDEDLTKIK